MSNDSRELKLFETVKRFRYSLDMDAMVFESSRHRDIPTVEWSEIVGLPITAEPFEQIYRTDIQGRREDRSGASATFVEFKEDGTYTFSSACGTEREAHGRWADDSDNVIFLSADIRGITCNDEPHSMHDVYRYGDELIAINQGEVAWRLEKVDD